MCRVEWAVHDDTGRLCPRPTGGDSFTIEADLVLLALGFVAPGSESSVNDLEVDRDDRGFIAGDARHMTNIEGLFVAGDMQRGASLVVHAIDDGIRTARQVAAYLASGA